MYESKDEPILSTRHFIHRMSWHLLGALCLILLTVLAGMAGHLWLEPVVWHDAMLNAAFIVGGVGPFILPATVAGKLFLSLYSIAVGLIFAASLGVILAPLAHRIIHKFHLDDDLD